MTRSKTPTALKRLHSLLTPIKKHVQKHPHRTAVFILLAVSLLTRFWAFGFPNQAVFDEVYFGKFVSNYFTHEYYFDIHPPLGKLLIAGFGWFLQFDPNQSFATIGTTYNGTSYMVLRFLPGLASALLPIVLYGVARRLGWRTRTALAIGLLTCLDTAFIVQGRFILIDSFLLLFGFSSLWAYLGWRNTRHWGWLVAAATFAGLTVSVKWTGLTFIALPIIVEAITWKSWRRTVSVYATYTVIPLLLYVSFFAIHIGLLTRSGEGDAFMSPAFQSSLEGSTYASDTSLPQPSVIDKTLELNYQMYDANARLTADHPYGSKWYQWPFMQRPISYWVSDQAQIWLIANPMVWLGSLVGGFVSIWLLVTRRLTGRERWAVAFLLGGFALNYLPFVGISRVMFLYHYLIPLGFALLLSGSLLNRCSRQQLIYILGIALIFYLALMPYIYGIGANPLSNALGSVLLLSK